MSVILPHGSALLNTRVKIEYSQDTWLILPVVNCNHSSTNPAGKCGYFDSCLGFSASEKKQKSNLFQFSSCNFISLICSNCFKMCKILFRVQTLTMKVSYFPLNMLWVIPQIASSHLWSDYSGISSGGSNGLDLHAIVKWERLLPSVWSTESSSSPFDNCIVWKIARREAAVKSHPVGAL